MSVGRGPRGRFAWGPACPGQFLLLLHGEATGYATEFLMSVSALFPSSSSSQVNLKAEGLILQVPRFG